MTWFTFTVTPIIYGDIVAGHLLEVANDPSAGALRNGAAIFRRLSRLRVEERVRWEVMASRDRPGESLREDEPEAAREA